VAVAVAVAVAVLVRTSLEVCSNGSSYSNGRSIFMSGMAMPISIDTPWRQRRSCVYARYDR